jgi:hypothetical protein
MVTNRWNNKRGFEQVSAVVGELSAARGREALRYQQGMGLAYGFHASNL